MVLIGAAILPKISVGSVIMCNWIFLNETEHEIFVMFVNIAMGKDFVRISLENRFLE